MLSLFLFLINYIYTNKNNLENMIKTFESFIDGVDDDETFEKMLKNNPMSKSHDLFIFIYKEGFKENDSGSYNKTLEIERMIKVTVDNYKSMNMINIRAQINLGSVGTIWWPKDAIEMIDDKSSDDMELWLIDTIEKHMVDKQGKIDGNKQYNKMKDKLTKLGKQRDKEKKFKI